MGLQRVSEMDRKSEAAMFWIINKVIVIFSVWKQSVQNILKVYIFS